MRGFNRSFAPDRTSLLFFFSVLFVDFFFFLNIETLSIERMDFRLFQTSGNQSASERRISKEELISGTRRANPVKASLLLLGEAYNALYPLFPRADCPLPRRVNLNVLHRCHQRCTTLLSTFNIPIPLLRNEHRKIRVRDSKVTVIPREANSRRNPAKIVRKRKEGAKKGRGGGRRRKKN